MASVICISHSTGSGGDEVGRLLADRLGFLYVNEEIVARAAAAGGLEPRDVADEEKRKSLAARIIHALAVGGGDMAGGPVVPYGFDRPDAAEIRALIRETIEQTAARGQVVISAHAAAHALDGRPNVLRILVTASTATRAGRLRAEHEFDDAEADRRIRHEDAGRRDYLKRFYAIDVELPTQYDLVINTDALTVDDAVAIVAQAAAANSND